MKILAARRPFADAIARVAGVVPSKSPTPILRNLYLSVAVDPDNPTAPPTVVLTATDLELSISTAVPGVTVERPGVVVLPTDKMSAILNTSDEDVVSIEYRDGQLIVKSDARFVLAADDPAIYPVGVVPAFDSPSYYRVAASDLERMIDRTISVVDPNNTTYKVGGVRLKIGVDAVPDRPGTATMSGTDGKRIVDQRAAYGVVGEGVDGFGLSAGSYIIPPKAAKLIKKIIRDLDDLATMIDIVSVNDSAALLFRVGRSLIYCRLIEGNFPKYERHFNDMLATMTFDMPIDVAVLLRKIEQAAIVKSDESNMIAFDFSEGQVAIGGVASGIGTSDVEMDVDYRGEPFSIGMDYRYITDALRELRGEAATLKMVDGKNPIIVMADHYQHLVTSMDIGVHKAAMRDDEGKAVMKKEEKAVKAGKKRGAA
jgi:DNA polymerase-3 subunit beta